MYGYADDNYVQLHTDNILERVSQEEIMHWVLGEPVVARRKFKNPLRKDNSPGCNYWYSKGRLLLADYADKTYHNKDCFGLVMVKYGCSFRDALELINQEFKLGLGHSTHVPKKRVILKKSVPNKKQKTVITYDPGIWQLKDKKYWSQWDISRTQLEEDGVLTPMLIRFETESGSRVYRPWMLCYIYTFPSGNIKIYQPYSIDKKWMTNTTTNDIGCFDSLDATGQLLIITKSYKDCRILRNMGYQSIWVQNEKVKIPDEILQDLNKRFERIILLYDNDETGIDGAKSLSELYNSKCSVQKFIPAHYPLHYGIKDTAEFYFEYGKDKTKEILHEITEYCT